MKVGGGEAIDQGVRRLSDDEFDNLRLQFSNSSALDSIVDRLALAYGSIIWLIQEDYRQWYEHDAVTFRGHAVMHSPTRASRLFAVAEEPFEVPPDNASTDPEPVVVAVITLRWRLKGHLGAYPVGLGRTIIANPDRLIGVGAFLLRERYSFFYPATDFGARSFWTFPFAEQDVEHHRCADVSLWMMFEYLSKHLGTAKLSIGLRDPELRARNHMIPAPGLYPDEMAAIISQSGLAPVRYELLEDGVGRRGGDEQSFSDVAGGTDGREYSVEVESEILLRLQSARGSRRVSRFLFQEVLHAYLDSQLPVIVTVKHVPTTGAKGGPMARERDLPNLHSICVIGHTVYSADSFAEPGHTLDAFLAEWKCYSTTVFVRDLVVHDDDLGPFLLYSLRHEAAENGVGEGVDATELVRDSRIVGESIERNAVGMFVGLPPEVRMPAECALMYARWFVTTQKNLRIYNSDFRKFFDLGTFDADPEVTCAHLDFTQGFDDKSIVISVYIEHASRLRDHVFQEPLFDELTKDAFAMTPLPKFVWVVELASLSSTKNRGREIFGEIVIDPSHGPWKHAIRMIRLPGVLSIRVPGGTTIPLPSCCGYRERWTSRNFRDPSGRVQR